jgi:serine/threonine protein kinase
VWGLPPLAQIDVVNCRLDGRVYVRKSIEKRFAMKTRDVCHPRIHFSPFVSLKQRFQQQCSPQIERDILLRATKTDSQWAPHLLCAFQSPTHLNLVMNYAQCGTLWDVIESSPYDGKVPEDDLKWFVPQVISAIHWCHSQGFAHRWVDCTSVVHTA